MNPLPAPPLPRPSQVAKFLSAHPHTARVIHPLLPSHPSNAVAVEQHGGRHSGIFAFYHKGGIEETRDVLVDFFGKYWLA